MKSEKTKKKAAPQQAVIHIDIDVHQKLKIYCAINKITLSDYVSKILLESLSK